MKKNTKGIIVAPRFMRWWSKLAGFPVAGVSLLYWVVLAEPPDGYWLYVLNHELIHRAQQRELWWVGFYPLYLIYYLRGRIRGLGHFRAYKAVPFELEANAHEGDLQYLHGKRKAFAWAKQNPPSVLPE